MSEKENLYRDIVQACDAAGLKASEACVPTPMAVMAGSQVVELVSDGVCGFAWIRISPGTSSFAKYLVKSGRGRSSRYEGGVLVSTKLMTQSLERNTAYAVAFSRLLNSLGVKGVEASAQSRID